MRKWFYENFGWFGWLVWRISERTKHLFREFDRCQVGNHRMGTRSGYTICRKHGDNGGWS